MDTKLNGLLYRILKGRLRFTLGGLSLFIDEPSLDVLDESYRVYDSAYEQSYADGCYVEEELELFLIEQDIWSPFNDKEIDNLKEELDNAKVYAYESFFKKNELRSAKYKIYNINNKIAQLFVKKHSMDHLSCAGLAEQARFNWIISKTTMHAHGNAVDWSKNNLSAVINIYKENMISHSDLRTIARNDPWRSMWSVFKKGGDLFNKPLIEYSKDQLYLCSYSSMYDNVYESQDSPNEKVIEDDDCLDGWFIAQRRKYEKSKKERETEDLIRNPKIKNAKEVFLVTQNPEDARQINDLNSPIAKNIIQERQMVLSEKGQAKDLDFYDIKQDIAIQHQQAFSQKMRGRR